ncbi:hypothetical protein MWU59_14305 [Flavobacteriaceae bacterium F08102]|nr:hypothetical protein [Flavobacteriaceae bacterium F08102]
MKKVLFILLTAGILFSCNKDDDNIPREEVIEKNITLKKTENYEYDLGSFGFEEGAWIQTQAKHFEISEVERDINFNQIIYRYKPALGYIGKDYVEIKTGRGSDGASPSTEIEIIKITFNVTE